jgi:hypothetical protein
MIKLLICCYYTKPTWEPLYTENNFEELEVLDPQTAGVGGTGMIVHNGLSPGRGARTTW